MHEQHISLGQRAGHGLPNKSACCGMRCVQTFRVHGQDDVGSKAVALMILETILSAISSGMR